MPYAPGISYRGDQWIAQGGEQMGNMAMQLMGYFLQKGDAAKAREREAGGMRTLLESLQSADSPAGGAPAPGGGPAVADSPEGMLEGLGPSPAPGDEQTHPMVQKGQQADAMRKLIQSYAPEAKDMHTALKAMSVEQLEGLVKGYTMKSSMAEQQAKMEDLAAQRDLRKQQIIDDQTIGQAVNRYAQTPDITMRSDGETQGEVAGSRTPTAEERFRYAMATPGLAGRHVPKLLEALTKYGQTQESVRGAKPPIVTPGPYKGTSIVQEAGGKGGLHILTDPEALTTRQAVDAQGEPIPGLYERGKQTIRMPDPNVLTTKDRTGLLSVKKAYLAERAKAFLPEDKKHWDAAISEVDAALAPVVKTPAAAVATVKSKAEYDKLPKGTKFTGADGKTYVKP